MCHIILYIYISNIIHNSTSSNWVTSSHRDSDPLSILGCTHTEAHTHCLLDPQLCMPGRERQEVSDGRTFPGSWTLLASGSLPSGSQLPRGSPGVTRNSFQPRERQKKDYPAIQGCPGQNPGQNIVFKILENEGVPGTFEPAWNNGMMNSKFLDPKQPPKSPSKQSSK